MNASSVASLVALLMLLTLIAVEAVAVAFKFAFDFAFPAFTGASMLSSNGKMILWKSRIQSSEEAKEERPVEQKAF